MNNKVFNNLFNLAANAEYNPTIKNQYKRLGLKVLKQIANELNLTSYIIKFNPGGIAVTGDLILHDERFYLNLTPFNGWFMHRSCGGNTDYTGGSNQIVYTKNIIDNEISALVNILKKKYYPSAN